MDNQEIASKLVTLKGKMEFFKSQKADNETKRERFLAELKSLGLANVGDLKASIEKMELNIKSASERLDKSIAAAEIAAKLVEDKLNGKAASALPPIEVAQEPPKGMVDEL
ncbi:Uncharacterised protein [uncultured archaeon]|nr:Uncharacterised protein [uncultured archaeon]